MSFIMRYSYLEQHLRVADSVIACMHAYIHTYTHVSMSSNLHLPQLPAVRLGKYVDSKPAVDILSLIIRVGNSKNTCVHAYVRTYIHKGCRYCNLPQFSSLACKNMTGVLILSLKIVIQCIHSYNKCIHAYIHTCSTRDRT